VSLEELMLTMAKLAERTLDPVQRHRQIGDLALAADTPRKRPGGQ